MAAWDPWNLEAYSPDNKTRILLATYGLSAIIDSMRYAQESMVGVSQPPRAERSTLQYIREQPFNRVPARGSEIEESLHDS